VILGAAAAVLLCALALEPVRQRFDLRKGASHGSTHLGIAASARTIWRRPDLRRLTFMSFAYCALQVCVTTYLVTFSVVLLGQDLTIAGIALAANQFGGVAGRVVWGAAAEKLIPAAWILAALGLVMSATSIALGLSDANWPYAIVIALAFVLGLSASGWNGVGIAEMARLVPPDMLAPVMGAMMAFTYLGLVSGPILFATLTATTGMRAAFVAAGLLSLLGALAAFGIARRAAARIQIS
ncbi:MAG: MFS transporter, partial [Alphaproteobacteria bacterium]|nr:MFS transporter [Alphaproteobacteria bacterium]